MPSLSTSQPAMSSEGIGLEPVKVFTDLSNKIAATKRHFEDYSSGVSKLLKLKDDIFHKAVTRKPLTTQQLTNMAVVSSSLFLSKAAIEEQLSSVNSLAVSSVKQAEVLPSRALLHWTLLATKLLRRLHISEHLQVRYCTARMLEIWDLAAASMPASPDPTPRLSVSKAGKGRTKQGTGAPAPSAPSPPPQARPSSPGKTSPGTTQGAASASSGPGTVGKPPGSTLSASVGKKGDVSGGPKIATTSAQPALGFPTLPSLAEVEETPAASGKPVQQTQQQQQRRADSLGASSSASLNEQILTPARDAPLLQVNPVQLSRSSSRTSASPRGTQQGADAAQGSAAGSSLAAASASDTQAAGLAWPPEVASTASAWPTPAGAGIRSQGSGHSDLLAAVNAVAGRLSLRHTTSQSSYAALPCISEAAQDSIAAADVLTLGYSDAATASGAVLEPSQASMFSGAGPSFRRVSSNLRTGDLMTTSVAADLPRTASLSGKLSRQTSRGLPAPTYTVPGQSAGGDDSVNDEIDWRS